MLIVATFLAFIGKMYIKAAKGVYEKLMDALESKELAGAAFPLYKEAEFLKQRYPEEFFNIAYTVINLVDEEGGMPHD